MNFSDKNTKIMATGLLFFVFAICVLSIKNDAVTMDEVAHLPAGYSYLTQKDMRINPEHPPLIKDLAGFPLLFLKNISFPSETSAWQTDINGQWAFGFDFLYNRGNPVDKMIFLARIPMILVLVCLGFFVFKWARELWGNKAGLFALFLFSFSPTLLAHGRLVTTDIAATIGIFTATYYFLKALDSPSKKNIILAGISFGIAQLLKFTAFLLVPFFMLLTFVWIFLKLSEKRNRKLKELITPCILLVATFCIGFLLVWAFYLFHVANYPVEKQVSDATFLLSSHQMKFAGPLVTWMAKIPILRAFGQYLLGLFMVFQRASFGHTTYFMGEVSAAGWKSYFPIVYFIKETLSLHILTLIAVVSAILSVKKYFWKNAFARTKNWLENHFQEFAMLTFIAVYWASSLTSSLNIGVRHLLPIFPFVILLVSKGVINWIKKPLFFSEQGKYIIIGFLLIWQAVSVVSIFPHFLAYFNEIAGGPDNGYIYVVDSNLDWGQDLRRLKQWVDENNIEKIHISYFGGGNPEYYFQEKYLAWWETRNPAEIEKPGYLAVSASLLQGGRGKPAPGFNQPHGFYNWLNEYEPVAKIGYSIFIYRIE
ncbi:MAG: glycosyltransferase family 39 protein [Candidatus Pacebacteria bacterium]|nr:glycosyltransferase family 39 protein [Candidatus Paceibacterota bacterium]